MKIMLATALMSLAVGAGWFGLGPVVGGRLADVLAVVVLIPLGCAIYGGLLWWLKIEGREELELLVKRFFARRA
jgi:putative peptidoglycan lipid II flippase